MFKRLVENMGLIQTVFFNMKTFYSCSDCYRYKTLKENQIILIFHLFVLHHILIFCLLREKLHDCKKYVVRVKLM
jgi:hypothetical protein